MSKAALRPHARVEMGPRGGKDAAAAAASAAEGGGEDASFTPVPTSTLNDVMCGSCEETVPYMDSVFYTRFVRQCKACQSNQKRNSYRCKSDRALKAWWSGLSKEDRVSWYRRQKASNPRTEGGRKRKRFEDMRYSESETMIAERTNMVMDRYVPFEAYAVTKAAMGLSPKEIQEAWKADLADPAVQKMRHGKQWLVYSFGGIESASGMRLQQASSATRSGRIDDMDEVDKWSAEHLREATQWLADFNSPSMASPAKGPVVQDSQVAQGRQRNDPPSSMMAHFLRSDLALKQEDAEMAIQLEEEDTMAAQEYMANQKETKSKAAVGRPMAPLPQRKAEFLRSLRDTRQSIDDGIAKLNEDISECEKEVAAAWAEAVPQEVSLLVSGAKVALDEAREDVAKAKAKLTAMGDDKKLGEMVEKGILEARKELVAQMAEHRKGSGTKSAGCRRAIAALRKGMKKASSSSKAKHGKASSSGGGKDEEDDEVLLPSALDTQFQAAKFVTKNIATNVEEAIGGLGKAMLLEMPEHFGAKFSQDPSLTGHRRWSIIGEGGLASDRCVKCERDRGVRDILCGHHDRSHLWVGSWRCEYQLG